MIKKIFSAFIFCIGLVLILYPKAMELYENEQQKELTQAWQESLSTLNRPEPIEEPRVVQDNIPTEEEQRKQRRAAYIQEHLEGMLIIEKIQLNLPILKGASERNLSISLASLEHTGQVGEIGNYVIAGHRSHTYGRLFNRLNEVEVGDLLEIDNGKNKYRYIVSEKLYVKPDAIGVLTPKKGEREITLITCHPMINPTQRLILKGKLLE
jgi:sortase A